MEEDGLGGSIAFCVVIKDCVPLRRAWSELSDEVPVLILSISYKRFFLKRITLFLMYLF